MYITVHDRPAGRRSRVGERHTVAPVVVSLGFVSMLTDISSESVSAILPLYLTSVLGLSTVAYGFLDGLYQGVSALVRIAGGWAADRGDHPKWVAFIGYGLSLCARLGLLFAGGFAAITAIISADRIGKGIRTAPRDAMIAAATPDDHLGHAFGVHRTLDTVGAAIGPLLAFAVLWAIPDGYTMVIVLSSACALLGVALLGLLVPDLRPRAERAARAPGGNRPSVRWRDLADPRLARLLVVAGALGVLTIGDGFIYLALLDRGGFAATWFPMLYVGTNIAYLCLAIPVGRIADRVGRARVLILGHLALLLTYVSVTLPLAGVALVSVLLLGTFYACTDGVIAAVAGRVVSAELRASGIATAQTVVALARLLASTGFGLLWVAVGPRTALLAVAATLLLVIVIAYHFAADLDKRAAA